MDICSVYFNNSVKKCEPTKQSSHWLPLGLASFESKSTCLYSDWFVT